MQREATAITKLWTQVVILFFLQFFCKFLKKTKTNKQKKNKQKKNRKKRRSTCIHTYKNINLPKTKKALNIRFEFLHGNQIQIVVSNSTSDFFFCLGDKKKSKSVNILHNLKSVIFTTAKALKLTLKTFFCHF